VEYKGGKVHYSGSPKKAEPIMPPLGLEQGPPDTGAAEGPEPQNEGVEENQSLDSMLEDYSELYQKSARSCNSGQHSHSDYGNGRCHPTSQVHRGGKTDDAGPTPPSDKQEKSPSKPSEGAGDADIPGSVKKIFDNRQNIGRPGKYIRHLGAIGETVAKSILGEYKAHESWNSANDLSNDVNIEIKLLSPNSKGTPIMPNAHKRKVELKNETGKDWKFIFLRPTDTTLEVFELDEPEDFVSQPNEAYVLSLEDFSKVGEFDQNGQFVRI